MASPTPIRIATLHSDLDHRLASLDLAPVEQSRRRVEIALQDGKAHYGINTGFGALARKRVPDATSRRCSGTAPEPRGRRRRTGAAGDHPAHAAAEDPRPRARLLRRVAADVPPAARVRPTEPGARRAEPRQRRGVRRSRSARAPVPAADRVRRVLGRRPHGRERFPPPTCSARTSFAPIELGGEGRSRAHQRHATHGRVRRVRAGEVRRGWSISSTSPPRCRSKRCRGASSRSTRGFTRSARTRGTASSPRTSAGCSTRARFSNRTATAGRCKTRTACGACRRFTARAATRSPTPPACSKPR